MRNKKGHALVEFILIIPVLVLFLMGMFDISNVIYKKYQLENDLDYIVDLYESGAIEDINTYLNRKNISASYDIKTTYTTITLSKNISFITPGASKIIGSTYTAKVERTISNES